MAIPFGNSQNIPPVNDVEEMLKACSGSLATSKAEMNYVIYNFYYLFAFMSVDLIQLNEKSVRYQELYRMAHMNFMNLMSGSLKASSYYHDNLYYYLQSFTPTYRFMCNSTMHWIYETGHIEHSTINNRKSSKTVLYTTIFINYSKL